MSALGPRAAAPLMRVTPLRAAAAMVVAFIAVLGLAIVSYAVDRARIGLAARSPGPDQIAGILLLLETTPAEARLAVLRAVNGAAMRVALGDAAAVDGDAGSAWVAAPVARLIADAAPAVAASLRARLEAVDSGGFDIGALVVVGRLSDGAPIEIVSSDTVLGRLAAFWVAAGVALLTLLAAAAALGAYLRIARPLEAAAEAARRIGADPGAPPPPLVGPPELRAVAAALAEMQRRLAQLMQERAAAMAMMAHDLRGALARLTLRLARLPDGPELRRCRADLERMRRTVEDQLAYARLDDMRERPARIDLAALAQDLCDDAAEADRRCVFVGDAGVVAEIRPAAIARAVQNLIENACRHGGGAVEVAVVARADGGAEVEARDRGPGIPPELREAAFEPWRRLGAHAAEGSGLGLAIARGMARLHGGTVTLEDRPGGGLIARLTVPGPGRDRG